jgi:hypothetical protein
MARARQRLWLQHRTSQSGTGQAQKHMVKSRAKRFSCAYERRKRWGASQGVTRAIPTQRTLKGARAGRGAAVHVLARSNVLHPCDVAQLLQADSEVAVVVVLLQVRVLNVPSQTRFTNKKQSKATNHAQKATQTNIATSAGSGGRGSAKEATRTTQRGCTQAPAKTTRYLPEFHPSPRPNTPPPFSHPSKKKHTERCCPYTRRSLT